MKSKNQINDAAYNDILLEDRSPSLQNFKSIRDNRRLFLALLEYIGTRNEQIIFSDILRQVILKEKTYLSSILKSQLKKLKEIDAPQHIIKSKMDEVSTVFEALSEYGQKENNELLVMYMQNLEEESKRDLLDLTTNFAGESPWALNLDHEISESLEWKLELLRS